MNSSYRQVDMNCNKWTGPGPDCQHFMRLTIENYAGDPGRRRRSSNGIHAMTATRHTKLQWTAISIDLVPIILWSFTSNLEVLLPAEVNRQVRYIGLWQKFHTLKKHKFCHVMKSIVWQESVSKKGSKKNPTGAWMSVVSVLCVFSGRGLGDELITGVLAPK